MLSNVLFGCLKQVGHELLGQPNRLILQSHVNFDPAVLGLIDEKLALTGLGAINGYQIFAHERTASSMSCSTRVLAKVFWQS